MNTAFLLLAQYDGQAVIPVEEVCKDIFGLSHQKFMSKLNEGHINLPVIRMEGSQKCRKGVHIGDLAKYIDERREEAQSRAAEFAA